MPVVSYDRAMKLFEENGWVLLRTQTSKDYDYYFHVFQEPNEGFLWNVQVFDRKVSDECFRKIKEYFESQTQ